MKLLMWVCVKEAQIYVEHTGEGRICSGMPGDLVECNVMLLKNFQGLLVL